MIILLTIVSGTAPGSFAGVLTKRLNNAAWNKSRSRVVARWFCSRKLHEAQRRLSRTFESAFANIEKSLGQMLAVGKFSAKKNMPRQC